MANTQNQISSTQSTEQPLNPFISRHPVPAELFVDRRKELRRITGLIVNRGQSAAIEGGPRSGKTSLLMYLCAPETREKLYGAIHDRFLFTYVDALMFGNHLNQAQFWEYTLRPLYQEAIMSEPDTDPLVQAYKACQVNDFGAFVLERLLFQMQSNNWRLVLLMDEFDSLLHHPIFNSAEFFGSLRSLASRSKGALVLVIASRRSLTSLIEKTQQLSLTGSPYFNIMDEITLGPLPHKYVEEVLRQGHDRFTPDDRRFITAVAGGHPCLLQMTAYEQWEAFSEDDGDSPEQRRRQVGECVHDLAKLVLSDTWRLWSSEMRRVFSTIALDQLRALAQQGVCGPVILELEGLSLDQKTHLHRLLVKHFDEDELRTLCFELGEDYERLQGANKTAKARELVLYLERRERIPELITLGAERRPKVTWSIIPSDARKAAISLQTVPSEQLTRNYRPELRSLKKQGFVQEDEAFPGGWRVRPEAFLWWLADAAGLLENGALELIEAVAKGQS